MTQQPTHDRYPGIRSFEKGEKNVFFGREEESADLFGLVKTRPLVVLFSKSGLGKSSLINAGLSPKLENENFMPITVRFQNTDSTPLEILNKVLDPFIDREMLKKFAPNNSEQQLWHKFKSCKSPDGQIPVFVFDQFEEFFNHPATARLSFASQLADLVEFRLPENELAKLQAIPRSQRTAEQMAWFTPVESKFLIAIRSDRLSELNEMSVALPSVLQSRFELKALNSAKATRAIEAPAQLDGDFSSPKFKYHADTLKDILDNLRGNLADEIESFQLQILCGEVEKMVRTAAFSNVQRPTSNIQIVVTPDYLGGAEGIRNILNNYYENQITGLDVKNEQPVARLLIEDQLIANGKRIGAAVESITLPAGLAEKLLLSRLIRRAPTHLGDVYEISHDTLVAPIVKSRDLRHQLERQKELEDERLANEAELAEQKKRLEEERELRADAEKAKQEAIVEREKAEAALSEADRLRKKAEGNALKLFWTGVVCVVLLFPLVLLYIFTRNDWERDRSEAVTQRREQKFADAKETFQKMKDYPFYRIAFLNRNISLEDSIAFCQKMEFAEIDVEKANAAVQNGEYFEAKKLYEKAKTAGFAGLEIRIMNVEKFRQLALDNYTRKAETFFEAKAFDLACENFFEAAKLDPENLWLQKKRAETRKFCGK